MKKQQSSISPWWAQLMRRQGLRIARRLNRYTARWPPNTWKIAWLLFILLCSAACIWMICQGW